jgi:excisionase family DNA binding protein
VKQRIGRPSEACRLLSPDQAAVYLGLGSRWAVYRLVAAGELPAVKLAGKLRLDRIDLDQLIQEKKRPVPGTIPRPSHFADRPRASLAPLGARHRRAVTVR